MIARLTPHIGAVDMIGCFVCDMPVLCSQTVSVRPSLRLHHGEAMFSDTSMRLQTPVLRFPRALSSPQQTNKRGSLGLPPSIKIL